jgi:hypothetical protein
LLPVIRAVVVTGLFVLVTLADAVLLLGFFGLLLTNPSDIGGGGGVGGFLTVQIALTAIWIPLLRALRRRRPSHRPPGRSAGRYVQRAFHR